MRFQIKSFALGFVCCALFGAATAYAAVGSTQIDVFFKDLKYIFNGESQLPEPDKEGFIYKGTTYVPIRFVGEALGKEVGWDELTETIRISDDPGEFSMEDLSIKDELTGTVITLGMSKEEVESKLSAEPDINMVGLHNYDGLQIFYRDNQVVGMVVSADNNETNRYRTNRDIGIGFAKDHVYRKYGNAVGDEDGEGAAYILQSKNSELKKVPSILPWEIKGSSDYVLSFSFFDNTNQTVQFISIGDHIFTYTTS
ncbi:copper amine oxidase N-terminal domain-containing protein [Paenibacillus soyae]|uniref:Copper amine oxidase N-terminal domain-containing protein n=1 Tax=Paenibacillus soyae TaxID=2969249 RepID=A0A9X2S7U5_9BACL|nr:copper amine oxidase N-terminal domain-containing protein [Paenibacillus soyae]MCR2803510.1 copper amine oxidase N-terminal domain-containing protein [Paenibacillus soyae]